MKDFGFRSIMACSLVSGVLLIAPLGDAYAGAVIDNGVVRLGVNDLGALNFDEFGLFSIPSGSDSTFPGCTCEGWGVGIASTGEQGNQNTAINGTTGENLRLVSFTSTTSTAVSVVDVLGDTGAPILRVTHDYHPLASTTDLYEVLVSITNLTGEDLVHNDLRLSAHDGLGHPVSWLRAVTDPGGTGSGPKRQRAPNVQLASRQQCQSV